MDVVLQLNDYPLLPDPDPGRVRTILWASIPADYVAGTAERWAAMGFGGFLLPHIMTNWEADIWALPDGARIAGEENPRLRSCRRMNDRLRTVGCDETFIGVAFHKALPDWFDDAAWATVIGNFREGARFARFAGFRGLALDDEYIEDSLGLEWEPYRRSGRSNEEIVAQVRRRGREIQQAMLAEHPDMVTLHLPESISIMGELAKALFRGYLDALVAADAPGGMHLFCESTYFMTRIDWIGRYGYGLDRTLMDWLEPAHADYWARRCGVSLGLAPLGYLRFIRDESGKRLGYGGRKEVFGDRLIAAGEDKSGNYPAETFARTYAAARMTSRRYVWIFSGGPVWWQMTPEEREKHGGPETALIPTTEDFDAYVESVRNPKIIDRPDFRAMDSAVRTRTPSVIDPLAGYGMPPAWQAIGAFPNPEGRGFDVAHEPEREIDLGATYDGVTDEVRWHRVATPPMGYVDLSRLIAGGTMIQGYAACWCDIREETEAVIRYGCDDAGKISLNGALVHTSNTERIAMPDEDSIPIRLPAGRSCFLLKTCNYRGGWGFFFRVTDRDGNEIPALRWLDRP